MKKTIQLFIFYFVLISSSFVTAQTAGEYIEAGQMHFKNKTYYDALRNFNRAFMTDSNNIESLIWRGQTKAKLGLYEEALKDYQLGILIKPNENRFYTEQGMILNYQGKYEQAIKQFATASNLQQKAIDFLMIAELQTLINKNAKKIKYNYSTIIKYYSKASLQQPNWFLPYRRIGELLNDSLRNNNVDDIEMTKKICDCYQKAAQLEDKKAQYLFNSFCGKNQTNAMMLKIFDKGNHYFTNQNFDKAIEMYDKIIENGQANQQYYYQALTQKAKILHKKTNYKEAINYFSATLKLIDVQQKKQVGIIFYYRALSFIALENFENALIDFNQSIAFGLDNAYMYEERGNVKIKLNQKEDACQDWKIAEKKGSKEAQKNIKIHCKS